jgi:hypothetical protein
MRSVLSEMRAQQGWPKVAVASWWPLQQAGGRCIRNVVK